MKDALKILKKAKRIRNKFKDIHEDDIEILLTKFGYDEAIIYHKISKTKKELKLIANHLELSVSKYMIGIKKLGSGKGFQVTNYTLYTFLEEFNLKPSDLKPVV